MADTANNRIMIWKSIPTTIDQPADIELGQPDFNTVLQGSQQVVDNQSLRSPQGVWIQNGKLFVADTQNHRVLIWNSIPTQNRQPADRGAGAGQLQRRGAAGSDQGDVPTLMPTRC